MIKIQSFLLMFLGSAIVFGYTYGLDLIQALETPFREEPYSFTTSQFNLMYFFTFLPIFLFNIPIGIIIDRNEVTISLFVLLFMSLASQVVGTCMIQFRVEGYIIGLYVIRAFFGMAGEGIFTVQSIIVTRFCKKEDFELVLSLCLSLPFVFDSLNELITTRIFQATDNMSDPWYVSIGFCSFSLLCGLTIYLIYIRPFKQAKKLLKKPVAAGEESVEQQRKESLLSESAPEEQEQQQQFNLRELKSFKLVFWILILGQFFTEISLGSFYDNLNDLLVKRFNIPYVNAGLLLIIPFTSVAILSIVLSYVMSKRPKSRRSFFVASTGCYLLGQISLYLLPETDDPSALHYIVIIFFCLTHAFGFSIIFSGIQAAIPYVVDKKTIGTAFGVLGCAVGLSQSVIPFVNIAIIDTDDDLSKSYKTLNLAYIGFASASFCTAIITKCGPFEQIDQKFQDLDEKKETVNGEELNVEKESTVAIS